MISIKQLKALGIHKDFINRKAITCPHCEQHIVLPALAEKLISTGLLFSVVLAPLFYYWLNTRWENTHLVTSVVFAIGILLLVTGVVKNQPQPAPKIVNSHEKK